MLSKLQTTWGHNISQLFCTNPILRYFLIFGQYYSIIFLWDGVNKMTWVLTGFNGPADCNSRLPKMAHLRKPTSNASFWINVSKHVLKIEFTCMLDVVEQDVIELLLPVIIFTIKTLTQNVWCKFISEQSNRLYADVLKYAGHHHEAWIWMMSGEMSLMAESIQVRLDGWCKEHVQKTGN